jgi:hypothetical protein
VIVIQSIDEVPIMNEDQSFTNQTFVTLHVTHNNVIVGAVRVHESDVPSDLQVGDELTLVKR